MTDNTTSSRWVSALTGLPRSLSLDSQQIRGLVIHTISWCTKAHLAYAKGDRVAPWEGITNLHGWPDRFDLTSASWRQYFKVQYEVEIERTFEDSLARAVLAINAILSDRQWKDDRVDLPGQVKAAIGDDLSKDIHQVIRVLVSDTDEGLDVARRMIGVIAKRNQVNLERHIELAQAYLDIQAGLYNE